MPNTLEFNITVLDDGVLGMPLSTAVQIHLQSVNKELERENFIFIHLRFYRNQDVIIEENGPYNDVITDNLPKTEIKDQLYIAWKTCCVVILNKLLKKRSSVWL